MEFALGLLGSITGVASLIILIRDKLIEKPILKIGETLLWLQKDSKDNVVGEISFNIDNIGERSTTISRVTIIFGDHVEVTEELRDIAAHSSIRYPKKPDTTIKLFAGRKEIKDLSVSVTHTHKTFCKVYKLPQIQGWEKNALWKGGPLALQL